MPEGISSLQAPSLEGDALYQAIDPYRQPVLLREPGGRGEVLDQQRRKIHQMVLQLLEESQQPAPHWLGWLAGTLALFGIALGVGGFMSNTPSTAGMSFVLLMISALCFGGYLLGGTSRIAAGHLREWE